MTKIFILTGRSGSGKTTLIKHLIQNLGQKNISFSGLISPARIENGKKTGIFVRDLSSNQKKILAEHQPGWDPEKPEREWKMDNAVLEWGNILIENSIPASILIIDELGFLEFEKNIGWIAAFEVIERGFYNTAIIVVRNNLLELALRKWKNAKVISMENLNINNVELIDQILNSIEK